MCDQGGEKGTPAPLPESVPYKREETVHDCTVAYIIRNGSEIHHTYMHMCIYLFMQTHGTHIYTGTCTCGNTCA